MHLITYPDVVYKVANDAILIQTRCVQSVVSLEKGLPVFLLVVPEKLKDSSCIYMEGLFALDQKHNNSHDYKSEKFSWYSGARTIVEKSECSKIN